MGLRGRKCREAGEDCIMRSFITCTLHQCYNGGLIKNDDLGGACSTHGRLEKCTQSFG
jgi:hypothetical protein